MATALSALVAAAALACADSSRLSWMFEHRSLATNTLQITSVPSIGSTAAVTGTVNGLTPADYKIIIYAVDSSGAWWGAKYFRTVTYPIAADGTFSTDQWASGAPTDDVVANLYVAVVPAAYDPVSGHVWGNTNSIPTALSAAQVAGIFLIRPPAGSVWVPAATGLPNISPLPIPSLPIAIPSVALPSHAVSPAASPAAASPSGAATPSPAAAAPSAAASPSSAAVAPAPSSAGAPAASSAATPASSAVAATPSAAAVATYNFRPVADIVGLVRNQTGGFAHLVGWIHNSPIPGNDFKIAVFMTNDGVTWVDAIEIAFRPLFAVNTSGGFTVPLMPQLSRYVRVVIVPVALDFTTTVSGQETGMYPQVVQSALASATLDTTTGKVTVDSAVTAPVTGTSASNGGGGSGGSSSPIPSWGIAVIVVGGCLLIAGVGLVTGLAVRRHRQMQRETDVRVVTVTNPASRQAVGTAPPASAPAVDSKVMPQ